jgi:hypothetical protein
VAEPSTVTDVSIKQSLGEQAHSRRSAIYHTFCFGLLCPISLILNHASVVASASAHEPPQSARYVCIGPHGWIHDPPLPFTHCSVMLLPALAGAASTAGVSAPFPHAMSAAPRSVTGPCEPTCQITDGVVDTPSFSRDEGPLYTWPSTDSRPIQPCADERDVSARSASRVGI